MSPATRFDFTLAQLPDFIVLDSSVLLHLVFAAPAHDSREKRLFDDAKTFLRRLKTAIDEDSSCTALIPLQVVTECFHRITITAISRLLPIGANVLVEQKKQPKLLIAADVPTKLSNFIRRIDAIGIEIIQPNEIPDLASSSFEEQMQEYMRDLFLMSADAHILTVAKCLEIENIASLDRDFLRIVNSDFKIYTSARL